MTGGSDYLDMPIFTKEVCLHGKYRIYGHGRIETRKCNILLAQDHLLEENCRAWKDVHMLVKIESSRDISGMRTQETRYYISNETLRNASYYNSLAREHWGIENNLHWHLNVTF